MTNVWHIPKRSFSVAWYGHIWFPFIFIDSRIKGPHDSSRICDFVCCSSRFNVLEMSCQRSVSAAVPMKLKRKIKQNPPELEHKRVQKRSHLWETRAGCGLLRFSCLQWNIQILVEFFQKKEAPAHLSFSWCKYKATVVPYSRYNPPPPRVVSVITIHRKSLPVMGDGGTGHVTHFRSLGGNSGVGGVDVSADTKIWTTRTSSNTWVTIAGWRIRSGGKCCTIFWACEVGDQFFFITGCSSSSRLWFVPAFM